MGKGESAGLWVVSAQVWEEIGPSLRGRDVGAGGLALTAAARGAPVRGFCRGRERARLGARSELGPRRARGPVGFSLVSLMHRGELGGPLGSECQGQDPGGQRAVS